MNKSCVLANSGPQASFVGVWCWCLKQDCSFLPEATPIIEAFLRALEMVSKWWEPSCQTPHFVWIYPWIVNATDGEQGCKEGYLLPLWSCKDYHSGIYWMQNARLDVQILFQRSICEIQRQVKCWIELIWYNILWRILWFASMEHSGSLDFDEMRFRGMNRGSRHNWWYMLCACNTHLLRCWWFMKLSVKTLKGEIWWIHYGTILTCCILGFAVIEQRLCNIKPVIKA